MMSSPAATVSTAKKVSAPTPTPSRTGWSRGRSSRWCGRRSRVRSRSANGHSVEGQEGHPAEHHAGEERRRHQVPGDPELPRREQAQRAVAPGDVPVRLRGRGGLGRLERAVEPDRVDLGQAAERRTAPPATRRRGRASAACSSATAASRPRCVRCAPARELAVLLPHQDAQVHGDQRDEHGRHEQHVGDEQPGDHRVGGELAAQGQGGQPRRRPAGSTPPPSMMIRRPMPESRSSGRE